MGQLSLLDFKHFQKQFSFILREFQIVNHDRPPFYSGSLLPMRFTTNPIGRHLQHRLCNDLLLSGT
jgi:hypothetical protein